MTNPTDDRALKFEYTKDRRGNPLVIVQNFPGLGAEMTPKQLIQMSRELAAAAKQAERDMGLER